MPLKKGMLQEVHDDVTQMKTVLLGVPNSADKGLVGELKDVKVSVIDLNNRHRKLSQKFWVLIGCLAGSGILGTGLWGLLRG